MRKKNICRWLACLFLLPLLAFAQSEQATSISLNSVLLKGGWIMAIIGALSIVAIALTVFYILSFRASVVMPSRFLIQAEDFATDKNVEALRDHCKKNECPVSRIIAAGFSKDNELTRESIREAMEDEGARQGAILWQRLQYLMDVAVISPMVGLLGTVWGMMLSFSGIESGADFAKKAETMASGVAQAMYTTFGGLIVGIFAMAIYGIFRGHLNNLTGKMEAACVTVLNKYTKGASDELQEKSK